MEETPVISIKSSTPIAPTATPDVDEDGYSIQPKDPLWETVASKKGQYISTFYQHLGHFIIENGEGFTMWN